MQKFSLHALALCVGFTLGASAHAQAPAPAPAAVPDAVAPMDIPYGTPVTLERARAVAEAAAAEARKRNWKMAIAIVEPSGDLVYYIKLDGTMNAAVRVSQSKARAAATWRRPTKVFFDQLETGHPYVLSLDGVSGSEGGVPLMENGKLIGAIGVSGGSGAQDGVVARAGLEALK